MTDRSAKNILYVIFFFAVATKLTASFILKGAGVGPESFEYGIIADNILNGRGFVYDFYGVGHRAFIQPLYTLLTALVYYLTDHSQMAMLAVQVIVSSAVCFIVYYIATRFTGRPQALLAAGLTALHPGMAVYSVLKLHTLVLDTFLYLLCVGLILKFMAGPNGKNAVLAGFGIACAALSRSTILVFAAFSLIYLLFALKEITFGRRAVYMLTILISVCLAYSPWVIRNYKVFNSFVFIQTGSGENLWAGNNPQASGSAILSSGKSIHNAMPEDMRKSLKGMNELDQAKCYKRYFMDFVKNKPVLFLKLLAKKFYCFWWFSPQTGVLYPKAWLHLYGAYYAAILPFFVIGLASRLKCEANKDIMVILIVYMLSLAIIHTVVNVDTRHRWTVEPIMLIFASIGFFDILRYIKERYACMTIKR